MKYIILLVIIILGIGLVLFLKYHSDYKIKKSEFIINDYNSANTAGLSKYTFIKYLNEIGCKTIENNEILTIKYHDTWNEKSWQIKSTSAQQVDAPEPATMISPALQTPHRPAR